MFVRRSKLGRISKEIVIENVIKIVKYVLIYSCIKKL